MMESRKVFVGIDVCKRWLDVHVRPAGAQRRFANDADGWQELRTWLSGFAVKGLVMEATGGYERGVADALQTWDIPAAVVNPRQVRDFAKAMGKLAKTDRLDAAVLAYYAEVFPARPWIALSPLEVRLSQHGAVRDLLAKEIRACPTRWNTSPMGP